MSYQMNSTTIGGTVKHARRLNTKSGAVMAWAIIDGYKLNMESLFFGPLAKAVLNLDQEAQVEIKGRLQTSSHKDDSGTWINKIQLVANQITLPDGQVVEGAKKQADTGKQQQQSRQQAPPPDDRNLNHYDAQLGDYF